MERINNKSYISRKNHYSGSVNLIGSTHKNLMRNTLILGWNYDALRLYDKIKSYPALGYKVKGFITVRDKIEAAEYQGIPLLGDLSSLHSWSRLMNIEQILIDIEPSCHSMLPEIIDICKQIGISYTIVSDMYDTVFGNVIHEVYDDLFSRKEVGLRRFLDFLGAVFLMLVLLPLFSVIAIAIKLESKGSVFYSNTKTRHVKTLSLLSVDDITSNSTTNMAKMREIIPLLTNRATLLEASIPITSISLTQLS